jgi:hypothetical protein
MIAFETVMSKPAVENDVELGRFELKEKQMKMYGKIFLNTLNKYLRKSIFQL